MTNRARAACPGRARWRGHVPLGAVGLCLFLALTAGGLIGADASVGSVRSVRPRAGSSSFSPLAVRRIAVREHDGRLVATATIVNVGDAPVTSTTGLVALRGAGGDATGILTFSTPSLSPGSTTRVRLTTRPVRALRVGSGRYKALLCTDIYSQIDRFAVNTDCSSGGELAIGTTGLSSPTGPAPNTFIRPGLASVSGSASAVIRFASELARSTFACSLDGGPWLACKSPRTYTRLVDGPHTFAVRAISAQSKADPTPAHAAWLVDAAAPVVTLTRPAGGSTTSTTEPRFSGTAGSAPGDSRTVQVSVHQGASASGPLVRTLSAPASGGTWSIVPVQPLPAGTYTAQAEQTGSSGNAGVSAPSTFAIATAPALEATAPAHGDGTSPSSPSPPASYSVAGTVSGLSGTVVLQDNGGDDLNLSHDGPFAFATPLSDGSAYRVTVEASPNGQTCTVAGADGTVTAADVAGVAVKCIASHTLPVGEDDFNRADGGLGPDWAPISDGGLSIASQQVIGTADQTAGEMRVGESYGSDQYSQITVTPAPLAQGDWVGPSVRSQNGGQDTYLGLYWNDQLTGNYELQLYVRQSGNWSQLGSTYTLSGALAAGTTLTLSAIGSRVSFEENGVERIAVSDTTVTGGAPGLMTFGAAAADNWAAGTEIPPPAGTFSIGGTVSGLTGTVVLQDNGGDGVTVSSDAPFTFATPLTDGAAYSVTVRTNPNGQICTTANATGAVASADVTDVAITCTSTGPASALQIHYSGTDAKGIASYDFTSPDDGGGTHVLRVLSPTHPTPGVPHNFLYVLPVEPELGTTYGDGLETLRDLDAQDEYNLTIVEPSFSAYPWYADNPTDPSMQYETFMTSDLVPWVARNLSSADLATQPFAALQRQEQNWLIGFSKSGIGGQDLLLRHPDVFALAASWDFPADMSDYTQYGADNYGTQANFDANYRLTQSFLDAHKTPFLSQNRIWIGGYDVFRTDMTDYDALLTSEGILHSTEAPQQETAHRWDSGWVPLALNALSQDSAAIAAAP